MNQKYLLFVVPVFLLACTITKPVAQISEPFPTEKISPTPPATYIPDFSATNSPKACKVTAFNLNVRDDSSLEGHVITWLDQGDIVTILPNQSVGVWIHVQAGDQTGWINSNYCERITP